MGIFDDSLMKAYTHNGDHNLLSSLGLKTSGFERDWTDLGTVVVQEADDNEYGHLPAATVKVEVSALPAQFWKFTISRPIDDGKSEDVEVFEMHTGTGGFTDYWPMAKAVADNMISLEQIA